MKKIYLVLMVSLIVSCNSNSNSSSSKDSATINYKNIAAERTNINPDPVEVYAETVKSFATTDEFKVSLFETKETFHYLIKIQYKSLNEEDTLKIPDFGMQPAVEIEKGDSIRPSCVIGFLDEKKQFRELKLVYFEDNTLKIHVLKHYAVTTYQGAAK